MMIFWPKNPELDVIRDSGTTEFTLFCISSHLRGMRMFQTDAFSHVIFNLAFQPSRDGY